jgi:hypothetical protein
MRAYIPSFPRPLYARGFRRAIIMKTTVVVSAALVLALASSRALAYQGPAIDVAASYMANMMMRAEATPTTSPTPPGCVKFDLAAWRTANRPNGPSGKWVLLAPSLRRSLDTYESEDTCVLKRDQLRDKWCVADAKCMTVTDLTKSLESFDSMMR